MRRHSMATFLRDPHSRPFAQKMDQFLGEMAPYSTTYYFDQLIDHNDPSLGTFQQRFWFTSEHYQPGRSRYCIQDHFPSLTYS